MFNVVLPDPPFFASEQVETLRSDAVSVTVYRDLAVDASQLNARIKDADIIVVDSLSRYDAQSLAGCKRLKHLISATVGMNHVDMEYCKAHGITVTNAPNYNSRAVAEMAFANLISLLRHVPGAALSVRSNLWLTDFFEGEELKGKMLGVVGAGNVGRELIKIGQGFGMEVRCYTQRPSQERAHSLGIEAFYPLEKVLSESDFVILAVTATPDTNLMVNQASLATMRPSAYLINVGRYTLVDPKALAQALYQRRLAGAALDFVGDEPYHLYDADLDIQEMVNRPNVIVTPHIAFNTSEALVRLADTVYTQIQAIIAQK